MTHLLELFLTALRLFVVPLSQLACASSLRRRWSRISGLLQQAPDAEPLTHCAPWRACAKWGGTGWPT